MADRSDAAEPEGLHKNPAFTNVVVVEGPVRTVYMGSQNAADAPGHVVGKGDIAAQKERVLANVRAALAAGGARPEHVIKWNLLLVEGYFRRRGTPPLNARGPTRRTRRRSPRPTSAPGPVRTPNPTKGTPVDRSFWEERWKSDRPTFHLEQPNRLLVEHFEALSLGPGSRVLLPLCGKTLDIHWLLDRGYRVVGVELIEKAVDELFEELGTGPAREGLGSVARHSAEGIDVFVGDVFDATAELVGPVDAIYDRAALVALPATTRARYAGHLAEITDRARQLLICFEYDQGLMEGPPFSVDAEMVRDYYARDYELELLARREMPEGLKGHPADESVWLLRRRGR